jgi:hypothetical protein
MVLGWPVQASWWGAFYIPSATLVEVYWGRSRVITTFLPRKNQLGCNIFVGYGAFLGFGLCSSTSGDGGMWGVSFSPRPEAD